MGNAAHLLIFVAMLVAGQCTADDPCDASQCLAADEVVCARDAEDGKPALFADLCVLTCINCRLRTARSTTEFTVVNISSCNNSTTFIRECPGDALSDGERDTETEASDDGVVLVGVEMNEADTDGDEVMSILLTGEANTDGGEEMPILLTDEADTDGGEEMPILLTDDLPLQVMSSIESEMLRRMLMGSMPSLRLPQIMPPQSPTIVEAQVKVDITVNMNPPPAPVPRWLPPPPPPMAMAVPREMVMPPPPMEPQYQIVESATDALVSSAPRTAVATVAALAALSAAVLHI